MNPKWKWFGLRRTARVIVVSTALGWLSGLVSAEEASEGDVLYGEEVVVTGSRLHRLDAYSLSPISTVTAEDLSASGNITLENFLQDLPSTLGGADFGSSVNNGNPGLATVQLRGLGPNRTLVLLNGRRLPSAGVDGFVDLNMIPTAIIERIEVLRDGASTAYGSDAIAGVINIITKREFQGMQADFGYDVTGEGDGEQYNLSFVWGTMHERGSTLLSAQYTKRADIWQADRKFSECPYFESGGKRLCGGSGTTTPAQIFPDVDDADSYIVDPETGMVRQYDSAQDAYNYAAASYLVTPQEVYSLFGAADYTLVEASPYGAVSAFVESGFTNRESNQLMAAVGTFWSPLVPANHPANPFGDALCASNPDCTTPQDVYIARRLEESGGRGFIQDAQSWRFVLGLDGEFNNGWTWDVSYNYADWTDAQRETGKALQPNIETLLDPDACAADSGCPGVWNPFDQGTLTGDLLGYGTVAVNTIERSRMRSLQVNFAGDFLDFWQLQGGPVLWAVGYERRSESAESLPDGGAAIGAVYFTPGEETAGAYSVDEFYAELSLPVLAGQPWAEALTLEGSIRWSDYDFVSGSDATTRIAAEWAPSSDLRFRGVVSEGFRAPNIGELFLGVQKTAATYTDPCNDWDTSGDATLIANCGPGGDNLPVGFTVDAPQATTLEGGNSDLEPETSESFTFGIVFTPDAVPDLSVAIDYFDIEIEGAVGTAGTGNVINRCYNSTGFSDPLCALLAGPSAVGESPSSSAPSRRNALNQISGILLTYQNLSTFETSGVDFQMDYGFDIDVGRIDLSLVATYLDEYSYLPFEGGSEEQLAGYFGIDPYNKNAITAFPEWAINYYVHFRTGQWGTTLGIKWLDETQDGLEGPGCGLDCTADDVFYLDLYGYYEIGGLTIAGGIRNLTDKEPPYMTNYDDMNTLHYSYDTAGRYFYTRLSYRF